MASAPQRPARQRRPAQPARRALLGQAAACLSLGWPALPVGLLALAPAAHAALPVTEAQRGTAQQVAQNGVPLSELAADAPASHTVQRGDTLWAISQLFLKSPWRWPELWGMNLSDIRNPHLIYPGQVLLLVKDGDRASLRVARGAEGQMPTNTVKLSPQVRSQVLDNGAIASIPLQLIGPFLNEAMVLSQDELAGAPRIVATQEGRVLVSRGELAYVRGDLRGARDFTLYRESKPLNDPVTRELLGYEARFVGTAEYLRAGAPGQEASATLPMPATFRMTSTRQEAGVGDRLTPVPPRDYTAYVPHAPSGEVSGQIVSIYGEALSAGQNQIVTINRGQREGMERGHVLALWSAGATAVDSTQPGRPQPIRLPDERSGLLFVFRVFERVSYALIVSALDPIKPGDRFTQP